jgi:hypothetical protein
MIRASNQLSPKSKVVDLLFLYNFYFGQISSSYMEFWVSFGQSPVKISQNDHCTSCFFPVPVLNPCRDRPSASSSTCRARQRSSPSVLRRPYPLASFGGFSSSSLLLPRDLVKPSPSTSEQRPPPAPIPTTPRRLASIQCAPTSIAAPRTHGATFRDLQKKNTCAWEMSLFAPAKNLVCV